MSLKSKLEAVIYAAEEPVTLTQLATLFAADALDWKAEQEAAAAEQAAEVAGEIPPPLPLLEDQGDAQQPDMAETAPVAHPAPANEPTEQDVAEAPEASSSTPAAESDGAESTDPDAEAKRAARQREREVKTILKHLLDELIVTYASDDRGIEIREIAGGYRMATKPECHDAVRLFVKSLKPPLKLSLPALETLAVVAYKQPVTAPEVSEIRGVETGGVLGSLLARKLIATAGRKQVIGRPILYKTTKEFLLRFGLKDLSELPSMEEFEKMAAVEIEEMEPEAVAADIAAGEAAVAAAEAAEAEDLAQLAANSPSGEEMAEAEQEKIEAGLSANPADQEQEPSGSLGESPAVTAAEPSASSNEKSSSEAAHDVTAPADAPEETEATPNAQEVEEER